METQQDASTRTLKSRASHGFPSPVRHDVIHHMNTEAESYFQKARDLYKSGKIRKSSSLLRKASTKGHKEATDILAADYLNGRDARKSSRKAMKYMMRAAEMGDIDAAWSVCHSLRRYKWIPGYKKKELELKYLKMIADAEPDEEHFEFIMETAKLVSSLVREDMKESLFYREKYEVMKHDLISKPDQPLQST
jgi:TPR repeat protein